MMQIKPWECGRYRMGQAQIRQMIWQKKGKGEILPGGKLTRSVQCMEKPKDKTTDINKVLTPRNIHIKEIVTEVYRFTKTGSDVTYGSKHKLYQTDESQTDNFLRYRAPGTQSVVEASKT